MSKLDGMDPQLVRTLLTEVQHAAKQMDTIEVQVAHATRSAGVPAPSTHRPSEVADACRGMVRDVGSRLTLLEKKEKDPVKQPEQKQPEPKQPESKQPEPKQPEPESPQPKDPQPKDPQPQHKHELPQDTETKHTDTDHTETKDEPRSKPTSDKQEPQPPTKSSTETEPGTGFDIDRKTEPLPEGHRLDRETVPLDQSPSQDHTLPDDTVIVDSHGKPVEPIYDTPGIDHKDDIDLTQGRHVVLVDGVKVVVEPMNQPDPGSMAYLDQHMDEIKPIDMPTLDPTGGDSGYIDPSVPPPDTATGDAPAGATTTDPRTIDPRALAAAQPGDVLSAPANPLDESALRTLHDHYREIEPLDMPSVVVPEGQWGKGEWVPMDIQPDGPPGSIDPEPGGNQ
ncbi:hypothetical protein J5X84_00725 [Streptosporangiaceae bacterium NEAU-GS5]|nr:hypothetical protein [Streptosporangiaceae bacterium NEAU-GS5]